MIIRYLYTIFVCLNVLYNNMLPYVKYYTFVNILQTHL